MSSKAPPSRKEREKGRAPAFECGESLGQPPEKGRAPDFGSGESLGKYPAKTDCPMPCAHGRAVILRHSVKDIQKALKRI
jgi:hypothetical protein